MKVSSVGVILRFNMFDQDGNVLDLSAAGSAFMRYSISGVVQQVACMFGTRTAGQILYTVQAGDFPVAGSYPMEVTAVFGATQFCSERFSIYVEDSL